MARSAIHFQHPTYICVKSDSAKFNRNFVDRKKMHIDRY